MMHYYERIYGHPGQVQPAHIVVTSPIFESREVRNAGNAGRRWEYRFEDAPIDEIVALRNRGMSYAKIGAELGLPSSSVATWYKKSLQRDE